jgi:hypothetical protein
MRWIFGSTTMTEMLVTRVEHLAHWIVLPPTLRAGRRHWLFTTLSTQGRSDVGASKVEPQLTTYVGVLQWPR